MPNSAYIYVPSGSKDNLEIGLNSGLWGWRNSALDRAEARQAVQSLTVGDFLILGHKGPNSRVAPGGWADATLKRVIITRITRPYFTSIATVWPDDQYPERIGIDPLDDEETVTGAALGTDAMEALRLSANKQGVAVLQAGTAAVAQLALALPPVEPPTGDGSIDHDGEANGVAQVLVRREQQKLRRTLFRNATHATCALCGRTLPTRMLRAAHIKRRSKASREERLQMANIIPACLLGCDELFEHGYVYVTTDGRIAASAKSNATADLEAAAKGLAGQPLGGYSEQRAPFFEWHRENITN